jgi:hypothetical protein
MLNYLFLDFRKNTSAVTELLQTYIYEGSWREAVKVREKFV